MVLGGFHLGEKSQPEINEIAENFQALEVQKVAPLHCSGNAAQAIFKKYYGNDFINLKVGESLEV